MSGPDGAPRRILQDIAPAAFQHPLDLAATKSLESLPGIDWVIRKVLFALGEKRLRLFYLASSVRVGPKQLERVHGLYVEACDVLDIRDRPELFVAQHHVVNAAAIGVDRPFLVVNSSMVEMLTDDELRGVLGHELGHVLCGHALYTTTLLLLLNLWHLFVGIPGGIYALLAVRAALLEWSRKAELSADRAGLLTTQDLAAAIRVDMKLAGGRGAGALDLDGFLEQVREYERGGDAVDGVLKLGLLMGASHPFPVLRISELKKWAESGAYERILGGDYLRRSAVGEPRSVLAHLAAAAGSYADDLRESEDGFLSTMRDLGGGAQSLGQDLLGALGGVLRRGKKRP